MLHPCLSVNIPLLPLTPHVWCLCPARYFQLIDFKLTMRNCLPLLLEASVKTCLLKVQLLTSLTTTELKDYKTGLHAYKILTFFIKTQERQNIFHSLQYSIICILQFIKSNVWNSVFACICCLTVRITTCEWCRLRFRSSNSH